MVNVPVRLKYSGSESFAPGGGFTGVISTTVSARVQNLAFEKNVVVAYADTSGAWYDATLHFVQTFGAHDLFEWNSSVTQIVRCALRYSVAGQTFWDNNENTDYTVAPNVVGGQVALRRATARRGMQGGGGFTFVTSWVEGEIWVNNLSFNKRVGIRLSANNWGTFAETLAAYSGTVPLYAGLSHVERWTFKTPELNLDTSTPDFVLAVFYNNLDSGQWFWDNNFGQNFRVSKTDGSFVE